MSPAASAGCCLQPNKANLSNGSTYFCPGEPQMPAELLRRMLSAQEKERLWHVHNFKLLLQLIGWLPKVHTCAMSCIPVLRHCSISAAVVSCRRHQGIIA